jgi:hypothetical protein
MKILYRYCVVFLFFTFFVECAIAATSGVTGLQRQQLETSYIEGPYLDVFKAARTVFQNYGYSVLQSDMGSGFLLFSIMVPEDYSFTIRPTKIIKRMLGREPKKTKEVKVSVTLSDLKDKTEVRIGFTGVDMGKDYPMMIKRTISDIEKEMVVKGYQN